MNIFKLKKEHILFLFFLIFTPIITNAQPYYSVRVNNLWGVINSSGDVVISPKYDELEIYGKSNEFISARLGNSTYLINSELQVITTTSYSAIIYCGDGIFQTRLYPKTQHPNLYGLMDSTGRIIKEPTFRSIGKFNKGLSRVMIYSDTTKNNSNNKKYGIINTSGDWVVKPNYSSRHLKSPSSGFVNFYQKNKGWGVMNSKGEVVVNPKYEWLGPIKNGLMEYRISGIHGSGLMRNDETVIIPVNGTQMISYHPQSNNDTLVVIHELKPTNNHLGYEYINGKVFTIKGDYLFEIKYGSECSHHCNGFFSIADDSKKRGMMTSTGRIVVEPKYDVLQWCQEGLKQVRKDNKWGFIDDTGTEVIPCIYDDTDPFDNGLARVYIGGSWSDYIFPDKYPNVKMGYINSSGEMIWEPTR